MKLSFFITPMGERVLRSWRALCKALSSMFEALEII